MILKRLLTGAAAVLFTVLAVLTLTGNAGYLLYSTLGGWGFIMVGLAALVSKQAKAREPVQGGLPWKPAELLRDDEMRGSVRGRYRAHLAQRDAEERARRPKPAKLAVNGELPGYWDTWDSRVGTIERAARNGTISTATATERYGKMLDEYRKITAAPVMKSPLNQLYVLSSEYGLPVETAVLKAVHYRTDWTGDRLLSEAEFKEVRERLARSLNGQYHAPDGDNEVTEVDSYNEVSDDVPTVEESLEGYVPEGQDDLTRDLKAYLHRQVSDARRTPWTAGRKRHWVLSPEWAAEVRKLRDSDGKPLWAGPGKFLRGYPVFTDKHAGVPELVTL